MALLVDSVGYLIPRGELRGVVHSVFEHACNFTHGSGLLTLAAPRAGAGPTTLLLRDQPRLDLRTYFHAGVPMICRDGQLHSAHAIVDFRAARTWQPLEPRDIESWESVETNLRTAANLLARERATRASVIDGSAAAAVAQLQQAASDFDPEQAQRSVGQLIGWGEGLTPAGDDFLVGFLAGLDALANDAARRTFRDELGLAITARLHRTVDLSADLLRLAVAGHRGEILDSLRDSLLCAHRCAFAEKALQRALAVGATSGESTVRGLLGGLRAWLPSETNVARA
jgi:hypothetical protein